jgi:hypothetical protein
LRIDWEEGDGWLGGGEEWQMLLEVSRIVWRATSLAEEM